MVARAAVLRDPECFGVLVYRHQSRVRGYLRGLSGDAALADDLAQETFIRAWDKLASFSRRGRFVSWLLAIAHNVFLQSVRRSGRDRRVMTELEGQALLGNGAGPFAGRSDGSELVDLPTLLEPLTSSERAAIVLGYGYGFSHGEIARITGMPVGTIKSHIRRGKLRIRDVYGIGDGDEE